MIMKNVLIGTALNYDVSKIKNFVLSFRKYNQEDDIILIYHPEHNHLIQDFCDQHNIMLANFDEYKNAPIHVVASRFLKMLELVQRTNYDRYFISDVRDVMFQSNPFENLPEGEFIYNFTEDPGISIDREEHHIKMINRVFGPDTLNFLKDRKIICSGTIIGSKNKMLWWLDMFCQYLSQIQQKNPSVCFEMLLDQVIANHMYYFQDNGENIELKPNGDIVGTIGLCITHPDHEGDFKLSCGTFYLNGKVPAVIHQYDRSPEMFNEISEIYNVN